MTDWKLVRMHYEILGKSVQELSQSHNVSTALVNAAVNRESWVRHPIADKVTTWTKGAAPDDELMADVRTKSQILELIRTTEMSPEFFMVESLLLNKVRDITNHINDDDPDASRKLKNLVECVKELQPVKKSDEDVSGGVQIRILNHFGKDAPAVCDVTPVVRLPA